MLEMEVLYRVGSHAWIIKIIVIKLKIFNWDRYNHNVYKCTHEHTCDGGDRGKHVYAVMGMHAKMELVSYEPRIPSVYDPKHIGSKWSPNNQHFSSKYLYHFQY